jgi:plastocyanin
MKERIPIGVAALALAAAAAVIVAGGGGLVRANPAAEAATNVTVNFGSDWFCDPSFEDPDTNTYCTTTISVGDTVTWQWTEGRHDIVECGANWSKWDNQDEVCVGTDFDSGTLSSSNQTWSRSFDTPGEYWYVCTRHFPDQKGKIVVQEAAAPTPTPTEAPAETDVPDDTEAPTATPAPAVLGVAATPTPTSAPAAIPAGGGAPVGGGSSSTTTHILMMLGGLAALTGAFGIFWSIGRREM